MDSKKMKVQNSLVPDDQYDDGNIPHEDYPRKNSSEPIEPLPEYTRPRKDGPGGD